MTLRDTFVSKYTTCLFSVLSRNWLLERIAFTECMYTLHIGFKIPIYSITCGLPFNIIWRRLFVLEKAFKRHS